MSTFDADLCVYGYAVPTQFSDLLHGGKFDESPNNKLEFVINKGRQGAGSSSSFTSSYDLHASAQGIFHLARWVEVAIVARVDKRL